MLTDNFTRLNISQRLDTNHQIAQIEMFNWPIFGGGKKPPCPDPQKFYEDAIKSASLAHQWAEFAAKWALSGNTVNVASSLSKVKILVDALEEKISKFRDDWRKCGTKKPVPEKFSLIDSKLKELKNAMGKLQASQAVSLENAKQNISDVILVLTKMGSMIAPFLPYRNREWSY